MTWRNPVTAGIIDTITGKQSREQQLGSQGKMKGKPAGAFDIVTPTAPVIKDVVNTVFPASKDEDQPEICAKECGFLDLFCLSAKLQAACGGIYWRMSWDGTSQCCSYDGRYGMLCYPRYRWSSIINDIYEDEIINSAS